MSKLTQAPPFTAVEPVTDLLHGVTVTDPYRWLEDGNSPRTQEWLEEQRRFARVYLDSLPGRDRIRKSIREYLAVESYDLLKKFGDRYYFRKRLPDQQQPCIYMRDGVEGHDRLLLDPANLGSGPFTAVKPHIVSPDGRMLLYEIKEGGERTGKFALLDIESRTTLPDILPRGYLHGFAFHPECRSFYYAHEALQSQRRFYRAAYCHVLGTPFSEDREVFFAGEDEKLRLILFSDEHRLGILVHQLGERPVTEFYIKPFAGDNNPVLVSSEAGCVFAPMFVQGRTIVLTDRHAPNRRIVELFPDGEGGQQWRDIVPEIDTPINSWMVAGDRIYVSYLKKMTQCIVGFDLSGNKLSEVPLGPNETVRIIGGCQQSDELFLEAESFTEPVGIFRFSTWSQQRTLWARRNCPSLVSQFKSSQVWYASKDGTRIPMFLVGREDVLAGGTRAAIMTSYGGFGISMTPQFSVLVALLMERGCLFALPNIRGGSEFGGQWHDAARRRKRQTAFDDFLCAAEWLIQTGRTSAGQLAIFGGSNSGLLAGAALTQRPDLFCAVLCMVPVLDMLRYHLFDNAHAWRDELGTVEDPDDFTALAGYSPYHNVRPGVAYPATMIVSGDSDQKCNPLHARKMTARLQAANVSGLPILLDYSRFRGHSPVLPLNERIEALTDRVAFFCDRLGLSAAEGGPSCHFSC
jgi:prolyl oligopeptidase